MDEPVRTMRREIIAALAVLIVIAGIVTAVAQHGYELRLKLDIDQDRHLD
ncbi:MAG: hypothetical protein WDN27_05140 [Candidatus Saccharibacteria bacterium]